MSNREGNLQELLVASFESQMANVYTSIPCIVVAVRDDGDTALVDIKPTVNQRFVDGTVSERGVILGVPVGHFVTESSGVLLPIKVGTTGLAVFSMRSMETWKSGNGRPVTPNNQGKFDKSDASFFPGIQPPGISVANPSKHVWSHSNNDVVVFNNLGSATENEVRLTASGDVNISTAQNVNVVCNNANIQANNEIAINCSNFDVTADTATFAIGSTNWVGNITQSGNYSITGKLTFNGIDADTHRHTNVDPGTGTSGGPI